MLASLGFNDELFLPVDVSRGGLISGWLQKPEAAVGARESESDIVEVRELNVISPDTQDFRLPQLQRLSL